MASSPASPVDETSMEREEPVHYWLGKRENKTYEFPSAPEGSAEHPYGPPIIFEARGMGPPDMRIIAMGVEYHVHSTLMRMHMNFFDVFLDSADKAPIVGGLFRYEWVTLIDHDGTWSVVCSNPDISSIEYQKDFSRLWKRGNSTYGEKAQRYIFGYLLRAVYNLPVAFIPISQAFQLKILTDMAEYYCALPLISRCVDSIINSSGTSDYQDIFNISEMMCSNFRRSETVSALVNSAYKLRHQNLYHDLLIIIGGDCSNRLSADLCLDHEDIKKHIDHVKSSLRLEVKIIDDQLIKLITDLNLEYVRHKLEQLAAERSKPEAYALRPKLYRELWDMYYTAGAPSGSWRIYNALRYILQDDLIFIHNNTRQHKAMYRSVFWRHVPHDKPFWKSVQAIRMVVEIELGMMEEEN
ncbi:hypothetical protein IFR05_003237 [Cadophora sp. M221]|nr:hypothetical protein IFR05_003237 [Cadophora sp. M221]